MTVTDRARTIAALNDAYRAHLLGAGPVPGRTLLTRGIAALDANQQRRILSTVATFDAFTPDNDPWHEHDCASFELDGRRVMFKIDYYADAHCTFGAEDARHAYRVLTILLASEY